MLAGMAGGMSRPRPTVPVPVAIRGRSRDSEDRAAASDGPGRHCWVAAPADDPTARRAGLLVEWRRAVGGGGEGRVVQVAQDTRVSEDGWWQKAAEVREDLDAFLAGYLTNPASTERPLLVLGLPGAGKSVFTRVLAAQLTSGRVRIA